MMVDLGVLTATMAAAAVVVRGFFASTVFPFTSFVLAIAFAMPVYVILGILERVWENTADFFGDGGITSKLYKVYTCGEVSASIEMLKPIVLVFLTMMHRFTLSRRPKKFRKLGIWQGIEFSQSKPQARVDGSTGVMFSDVAEAVEELQEARSSNPSAKKSVEDIIPIATGHEHGELHASIKVRFFRSIGLSYWCYLTSEIKWFDGRKYGLGRGMTWFSTATVLDEPIAPLVQINKSPVLSGTTGFNLSAIQLGLVEGEENLSLHPSCT